MVISLSSRLVLQVRMRPGHSEYVVSTTQFASCICLYTSQWLTEMRAQYKTSNPLIYPDICVCVCRETQDNASQLRNGAITYIRTYICIGSGCINANSSPLLWLYLPDHSPHASEQTSNHIFYDAVCSFCRCAPIFRRLSCIVRHNLSFVFLVTYQLFISISLFFRLLPVSLCLHMVERDGGRKEEERYYYYYVLSSQLSYCNET